MTTQTTLGAQYLLEYADQLEKEVEASREANKVKTAKIRKIRALVPMEQVQEIEDQKVADVGFSFNNGALIQFLKADDK